MSHIYRYVVFLLLMILLTRIGQIFTCNHTATGRGESVNSSIKEKGDKKKELRGFNIYQLVMHLINQFERMESRSLSAICELVRSKKEWSKYVDDIWQDAFKGICELPYVKEVERDVFCVANTEDFLVILHTVTLDVGSFPKCTCNWFKSSKIPCPGICTVLSRRTGLFNKTNLHPRWRLENHPLYQDALRKLNLTVKTLKP